MKKNFVAFLKTYRVIFEYFYLVTLALDFLAGPTVKITRTRDIENACARPAAGLALKIVVEKLKF